MGNIIEEARRKAAARQAAEIDIREQQNSQEIEIFEFNRDFFFDSQKAFENTGIILTLQEFSKIPENYGCYVWGTYFHYTELFKFSNPTSDCAFTRSRMYTLGMQVADLVGKKLDSISVGIGWPEHWDEIGTNLYKISHKEVAILYHSNGSSEFVSAADNPHLENCKSFQFLTKEQWSSDHNLLATTLETAINNPYIESYIWQRPEPEINNNAW